MPLKFDLLDAKANLPPVIKSIEGFVDADGTTVRFALLGAADIRTFREDTNYVVDIGASDAKESSIAPTADDPSGMGGGMGRNPLSGLDAPETVPAKAQPAAKPQPRNSAISRRHRPHAKRPCNRRNRLQLRRLLPRRPPKNPRSSSPPRRRNSRHRR